MRIMTVQDVSFAYDPADHVLKKVNMELEQGKLYVIFGASGCGKTTLLSLLGGLDVPTEGQILFAGKDIQKIGLSKHRRENVSFIFQNYNLIEYLTPMENVALTARTPPKDILSRVGLTEQEANRNVLKLSGGQQQRVAIARALASDTPVILADEPTGNLDEDTSKVITALLKQNAKELNKCVIVVSHANDVAEQADVVYRLSHGVAEIMEDRHD